VCGELAGPGGALAQVVRVPVGADSVAAAGPAVKLNQSVAALFGERWERSAYLSGAGLVLAVLIAIQISR
jgi:hypothetical protein